MVIVSWLSGLNSTQVVLEGRKDLKRMRAVALSETLAAEA